MTVPPRLDLLKTLGDNTRYAIYLELARSPRPLATADIAESLNLHPNTVRPHLERMRDLGLLVASSEARGSVGRPQHRYALAPDAPSLGLEPPTFPLLARMLVRLAAAAGADSVDAADVGREQGRADATAMGAEGEGEGDAEGCVALLMAELASLGFDPEAAVEATPDGSTAGTVAFTHCPFRDLAEAHPELVCHLHRGLVEGFVEGVGGADVVSFGTLVDRRPCQVELAAR
ncbi:MAG TPA: helix-turn-helix domain-containing protein [Acidimicrobiales bacterium]